MCAVAGAAHSVALWAWPVPPTDPSCRPGRKPASPMACKQHAQLELRAAAQEPPPLPAWAATRHRQQATCTMSLPSHDINNSVPARLGYSHLLGRVAAVCCQHGAPSGAATRHWRQPGLMCSAQRLHVPRRYHTPGKAVQNCIGKQCAEMLQSQGVPAAGSGQLATAGV